MVLTRIEPCRLSPASCAVLLSQAGAAPCTCHHCPLTHDAVLIPSAQFRVLLVRRLRLPWTLAPHACSCRGRLDVLGDHRAACATSGVLASRAMLLERVVARLCRGAGARIAHNLLVADMNLDAPVTDDRLTEVVANGLSLWHGSHLAVDATIVSTLTRASGPHPGSDVEQRRPRGHRNCLAKTALRSRVDWSKVTWG